MLQPPITSETFLETFQIHDITLTLGPRYKKVLRWRNRTDDEVRLAIAALRTKNVWDSPDKEDRERVDCLDTLELLDDNDQEINRYADDGQRIPRRSPIHVAGEPTCGLLLNLPFIRYLFSDASTTDSEDDAIDDADTAEDNFTIRVYPQAFTRHYGHFQCNSIPKSFIPIIKRMNSQLPLNADSNRPVIQGVACQGYNHIQHCLTERAGALDLVQGRITSSLAGIEAIGLKYTRKHAKIVAATTQHLPHECVEKKLTKGDAISRSLRMEPVFVVDVQALAPNLRCGRSVPIIHITLIWTLKPTFHRLQCHLLRYHRASCIALGPSLDNESTPLCL